MLGALPAAAECVTPAPIARTGNTGSPFVTRDVTKLDTQTSDAVSLTGGCIDGVTIGHNEAVSGHFSSITAGGPATCSATSNASGASITSGTSTLTGSGFTARDVGKAIGVSGAGSTFLLATVSLAAVGSGYNNNDLITATGGTFSTAAQFRVTGSGLVTTGDISNGSPIISNVANTTGLAVGQRVTATGFPAFPTLNRIIAISGSTVTLDNNATATTVGVTLNFWTGTGAIFDFDVVNPGIYTVTAGTLTQGSTTRSAVGNGTGTGAQFTATFVRAPLATTIASFVSSTQVTLATAASATVANVAYAYGTDVTSTIQAGLSTPSVPLILPAGICVHTAQLTMVDKGSIYGQGVGSGTTASGTSNTTLLYLGPALNGAQLLVNDKSGVDIGGAGISLDGFFLAAKALHVIDSSFGKIGRLKTLRHTQVAVDWAVSNPATSGTTNWLVDQISANENVAYDVGSGHVGAHGMWMTYPNNIDTSTDINQFKFNDLRLNTEVASGKQGIPFQCGVADHNTYVFARFRGPTAKAGWEALGGNWATLGNCRQQVMLNLDVGEGGYVGRGIGFTQKSGANHIFFYDLENGSPVWVLETGAQINAIDNRGRAAYTGLLRTNYIDLQEPNNSTYLYMVKDSPTKTIGDLITAGGGPYEVLAVWTGNTGEWRVVGAVNQVAGVEFPRLAKTADYTVTTADNGVHFDNNGASGQVIFTLPAPDTGLNYCFAATATQAIQVKAAGGVRIRVGNSTTAADGYIGATGPTPSVCVRAQTAAAWLVTSIAGSWTIDGSEMPDVLTTSFSPICGTCKVATGNLDSTDTNLTVVPGLQIALTAGKTYKCEGYLSLSSGAAEGLKARIVAGGSLTQTSSNFRFMAWNGTTLVTSNEITDIANNLIANNAVYTNARLDGSIVVGTGGNIQFQAAQNTAGGTTTSVKANSNFACTRVN